MKIFNCYVYMVHVQALVNVPAISERSIRSDIATCKTTLDSQIQVFIPGLHVHTCVYCK